MFGGGLTYMTLLRFYLLLKRIARSYSAIICFCLHCTGTWFARYVLCTSTTWPLFINCTFASQTQSYSRQLRLCHSTAYTIHVVT